MSTRHHRSSKSASAAAAAAADHSDEETSDVHDVTDFIDELSDYSDEEKGSESNGSDEETESTDSDGTHITVDLSENELYKGLAPLLEDADGRTIIDVIKDGHILASRNHQEVVSCIAELVNELRKMNDIHDKYYKLMKAVHHETVQAHNSRTEGAAGSHSGAAAAGSHSGTFGAGAGHHPGTSAAQQAQPVAASSSSSSRKSSSTSRR